MRPRPCLHILAFLVACTSTGALEGARPRTAGPDFFDAPFPSLARTVEGVPDWSSFPNQGVYPLLDSYIAATGALDGAGPNAPVWICFETPIDTGLLPSPTMSLDAEGPLVLMDVDPASPERGRVIPVQTEWFPDSTTWLPGNLLAMQPLFGFPLRPHTTYAVLLRSPMVGADAPVVLDLGVADDLRSTAETLHRMGLPTDDLALVVPFRTQAPMAELGRMAQVIHADIGFAPIDAALTPAMSAQSFSAWTGHVVVPNWQFGVRPFRDVGGGFRFDDDGQPLVANWERVRFTVSVPVGTAPAAGWPIVLYSHGTGGDDQTFLYYGGNEGEAAVLAREGIAVIGISQPLHGDRGTADTQVELDSFNFRNIEAARGNFRQGALDQLYLAEWLARGQVFDANGMEVRLDPARIAYMGHSQGGLVGALAGPWLSTHARASVLSGAGGGLSMTVQLRKDPVDMAVVLAGLVGMNEDEDVTPGHPIVGLLQSLAEVMDPLNAAPWWYAQAPVPAGDTHPLPTLMTEGFLDVYTPSVTAEALAVAGGLPTVGTSAHASEAARLAGLEVLSLPTANDLTGWDGRPVTGGLLQFPEDGHFAVYDNPRARNLYQEFLASALDGAPRIGGR